MVDVSKREQMAALPEEVAAIHDHVHVLVNNAGVTLMGDLEQQTIDDLEWVLGINLWGVIFEIRDGKIACWRDYFDLATYTGVL